MSENCETCNIPIVIFKIISERQFQLAMLNVNYIVLILLPQIQVINFINKLVNLNKTLHPVGLALIYMLADYDRFLDYWFMRNDLLIKPLGILINDQFWMTQVILQLLKGLICARIIPFVTAWFKIDVQGITIDLRLASNLEILIHVNAVKCVA
jgi:hypothetical protein